MKFFIALFALAAVALAEPEADADPAVFYSGLNLGYRYGASPFAYRSYAHAYSPYRAAYAAYSPYSLYNNYLGYRNFYKRDAEAEADPAVFYSGFGYNYNGAFAAPYAHNLYNGYAHAAYAPYTHSFYNGYTPYAAHHAVATHAVATPTHVTQVSAGGVASSAAVHSGVRAFGGYANAGNYVANSAGVVHIAKREAEAEADPAVFYSRFGYNYAPFARTYATSYGHYAAPSVYGLGYRAAYNPYFGYNRFGYHF